METLARKITLLLFSFFICCSPVAKKKKDDATTSTVASKELFEAGKVLPKIYCKTDPSLSFALYLPASYDTLQKFPVIIFFNPQGAGNFVVAKYHHLAEEFGMILVGSNDSKNGLSFDQTNQIANTLISEVTARLSVENEITLSGFSGGARAALSSGMQNQNVSSVIYCGAAMPVQSGSRIFSVLGFAGVNDMNYTDVISFDQSLQNSSYDHFLIEWNGKHEWPDSAVFKDAFYMVSFNRMRDLRMKPDSMLIQAFMSENAEKIIASKSDWKKIELFRKLSHFLKNVVDVSSFETKSAMLASTASYQKELQLRNQIQQKEQDRKQHYIESFQSEDLKWWGKEIARLHSGNNISEKQINQRLLGFISLAGFSISSNAIKQNNFPRAEKMLAIYKLADPGNPDQPFLEACLYAKQGKEDEALQSLQHAVDLGLSDPAKILNEPALASLRQDDKFQTLLSKLKRP